MCFWRQKSLCIWIRCQCSASVDVNIFQMIQCSSISLKSPSDFHEVTDKMKKRGRKGRKSDKIGSVMINSSLQLQDDPSIKMILKVCVCVFVCVCSLCRGNDEWRVFVGDQVALVLRVVDRHLHAHKQKQWLLFSRQELYVPRKSYKLISLILGIFVCSAFLSKP